MKKIRIVAQVCILIIIAFLVSCESGSSPSVGTTVEVILPPQVPSDIIVTETGGGVISLSWTDNSDDETGFIIERKINLSGSFELLTTTLTDVNTYTDITATTTGVCYYYRVQAENSGGRSSYTDSLSPLPKAPSGLAASTSVNGEIELTWSDNSYYETGYRIERKSGTGDFALLTTLGQGATYYKNTGLSSGTLYTYRICASNSTGNSPYSNEVSKYPDLTPGAPGSLVLSTTTVNQIRLQWSDNSTNETGFRIERKNGTAGTWSQITTVGANVTTFTDTGLNSSTLYFYRVLAYNVIGDSTYSNEPSYYAVPVPPVPTNLNLTVPSDGRIQLTWTDGSSYETGFLIERRPEGSSTWIQTIVTNPNVTTYTDTGLVPNTLYYYRLKAININNVESAYSTEKNIYAVTLPAAPANLHVTVTDYWQLESGIYEYYIRYSISWSDSALNENSYYVAISNTSGPFYETEQLAANSTSTVINNWIYLAEGLPEHRIYSVNAIARNYAGDVASSPYTIQLPMIPPVITDVTGHYPGNPSIYLHIWDYSVYENQIIIERSLNGSSGWSQITTISTTLGSGKSAVNYNDLNLSLGTTYYYRVKGRNSSTGEESIYSYVVSRVPMQ